MNDGYHVHKLWPPCPYCGYKWPQKLDIQWLVARTDRRFEAVVQCPCGKSGILIRMLFETERLLDIEEARVNTAAALHAHDAALEMEVRI